MKKILCVSVIIPQFLGELLNKFRLNYATFLNAANFREGYTNIYVPDWENDTRKIIANLHATSHIQNRSVPLKNKRMEHRVKQIEFDKLRHAYVTVKKFLEDESYEKVESLNSKIAEDLSMWGDDNYDLLEKFVEKFELNYQDFEYGNHFKSEDELFGSHALTNLLTLSIWLPMKIIELLTINKLKLNKPNFQPTQREVTDMTFKDMITWYIEGKYSKEIKNNAQYGLSKHAR